MAAEFRSKALPPRVYDIGEFMGGYKKRSPAEYLADYNEEDAALRLAAATAKPLQSSAMQSKSSAGAAATNTVVRSGGEPRLKRPPRRGITSGKRVRADNAALRHDLIDAEAPDYDEPPTYQRQHHAEVTHSDLAEPPAKKKKRVSFEETTTRHGTKVGLKTRDGVVKMYPKKLFRKRNFISATDIAKPWPEDAQARITEGDFPADVQVAGTPRSRQHKIIEPSKRNPAPSHSTAAVDDVDSGTSIALPREDTAQQPALHGELSYIAENAAAVADALTGTQTIETAETSPVQDEGREVDIDILELKELVGKLTEKNGKLTEKNGKLTEKYRALKKENHKLQISNADMLSAFSKAGTGSRVHAQGEAYKARAEKRQLQGEMTELFKLQDRRKNEKMALITDRMAMEAAEPVEEVVFFGARLVARTDKVSALDDEVRKAKMKMAAAVGFVADDGWDELGGAGDV
ncbi:hypothetical protein LTR56_016652 [Elasticomyces elasticus]|nr:hypothetical protein LTR56_016652 [Elasticomyces elasticus]KAK3641548.1 hypothetical protein LTR22_016549 [Elasticomyces elasticus]KAK4921945.1 hypothetical protein LTR49_010718 [Elasticomyces elasticus]KAK5758158.1 hypothetical protein LTS12_011774 [Elasticomyces elasticus]